ncbi:FAD/NAD(P)-binding domain-containing protein [Apiospora arundinis]|uniref:FAD/NAD(P)-binding domain-containing protein n=1 Tax=Apiospora arundinis TaxID=335852 RepID=A0ABR2I310_9PEZI
MEEIQDQLPVLIIGAGSSGLAVAHGLKNANIPYKVFEQDPTAKPRNARDWAIGCHWSYPILAKLIGEEKWSRIIETQTDPNTPTKEVDACPVINGKTGEIIRLVPLNNFYRLLRSRFRAFMAEDVDVAWGKKLVDVSYDSPDTDTDRNVTAHFADGTSATGRLLLGADSSNSRVRALLLGPERAKLHRLSIAATFINCSFTREQALYLRRTHPLVNLIVHPDGMMGMLAALDMGAEEDAESRPETWRFAFYISWRTSAAEQDAEAAQKMGPRERLAQAKEKSRAFADPMRSAYEWMPDDLETVYYTPNGNWDPSLPDHRWDNRGGRITLVGDSAHPMTYHRGQGLNHALDDAGHIVRLLAEQGDRPLNDVINEYEAEMRPRAGEEVRLSEMNSYMLHDWDKLSQSPFMTASLTKGTPKSFATSSADTDTEDSTTATNGKHS